MKYRHQHDLNGCGIACLANLLDTDYQIIKSEFELAFYKINRGVKVTDIVRYLATKNLKYKVTYINLKKLSEVQIQTFIFQNNSIILLQRSDKYPIGHYLLRVETGWIDPWYNLPIIDNVYAQIRTELPGVPMYVIAHTY